MQLEPERNLQAKTTMEKITVKKQHLDVYLDPTIEDLVPDFQKGLITK